MLMTPLSPDNKVFSLLIQQERQTVQPIKDDKLLAHISKPYQRGGSPETGSKNQPYKKSKGTKIRSYCNKPGHTIEVCFKKHSLPLYLKKPQITQVSSEEQPQERTDDSDQGANQYVLIIDQQQALLALLQYNTSPFTNTVQHL